MNESWSKLTNPMDFKTRAGIIGDQLTGPLFFQTDWQAKGINPFLEVIIII